MDINDVRSSTLEGLPATDETDFDIVEMVTEQFELAIIEGVVAGQTVALEHLGEFSNDNGVVRFQPSEFFELAVQETKK